MEFAPTGYIGLLGAIEEIWEFRYPGGLNESAPLSDTKAVKELNLRANARRLVDGWGRFEAVLRAYHEALIEEGMTSRGADQFGTLLAAADVLRFDGLPSKTQVKDWALRVQSAVASEAISSDAEKFINHLTSSTLDGGPGTANRTIGELIERAAGAVEDGDADVARKEANKVLRRNGLKVDLETRDQGWVYVANAHQGLAVVFRNTVWQGRANATSAWVQAVHRLPGAEWRRLPVVNFNGTRSKATRFPLSLIVPLPLRRTLVGPSPSEDLAE